MCHQLSRVLVVRKSKEILLLQQKLMKIQESEKTILVIFPYSHGLEKPKFPGQLPSAGNERLFSTWGVYKANAKHHLHSAVQVTRLPREQLAINVHNYGIEYHQEFRVEQGRATLD